MFVRKKRNPSGIISVQIIYKSHGKYRMVETDGSSSDPDEVERLYLRGKEMIARMHGQQVLPLRTSEDELLRGEYEFILGARIKQESKAMKKKILALKLENGQSKMLRRPDKLKLGVSYSSKRASKDEYNRERGLKRLTKNIGKGKLTKSNLNNRGYNKFLKMEGEVNITLDREKIDQAKRWDGLKARYPFALNRIDPS